MSDPQKPPSTQKSDPLAEIKQLYFGATRATNARDFDRAIDLLKSLPDEDARERATVYMQGLAEMKKEWKGESAESEGRSAESVRSARSDVRSKSEVRQKFEGRASSKGHAKPGPRGRRQR